MFSFSYFLEIQKISRVFLTGAVVKNYLETLSIQWNLPMDSMFSNMYYSLNYISPLFFLTSFLLLSSCRDKKGTQYKTFLSRQKIETSPSQ